MTAAGLRRPCTHFWDVGKLDDAAENAKSVLTRTLWRVGQEQGASGSEPAHLT